MTPAFVQQTGTATYVSATSVVVPVTAAPAPSNRLILGLRSGATSTLTTVTDTQGNTWAIDAQDTAGTSGRAAIASTSQDVGTLTTADTITVTTSKSNTGGAIVHEYSGITGGSTGYLDGSGTAAGGSALLGAASMTTTVSNDLVFTVVALNANETTTPTISAPFTTRAYVHVTGVTADGADAVGAAGTYTASWAWPTAASWSIAMVGYLAGSPGGAALNINTIN